MGKLITILMLAFSLYNCGQTNAKNSKQTETPKTLVDTSLIAILPYSITQDWIFKNGEETSLTSQELVQTEILLVRCINQYNPKQEEQFKKIDSKYPKYKLDKKSFLIDLTRYKRQYVPVINRKGEKEVWINCFCTAHNKDWKNELIMVKDGGDCYFNLKVNLTAGIYYDLSINGDV